MASKRPEQPTLTRRRAGALTAAAVAAVPLASAGAEPALLPTDRVVLFPAAAHLDVAAGRWILPVHVWVYRPVDGPTRRALFARLLASRHGLTLDEASQPFFSRRVNLLLSDNLPGRRIEVVLRTPDGTELARLTLPETAGNGHSMAELHLPQDRWPTGEPRLRLATVGAVAPAAEASVERVSPEGVSIVSDIDDTVKITGVTDRTALWRSTFFKPFEAVPGMPALLRRLAGTASPVHYVSSTPWHLFEPVQEWMAAENLPASEFSLKYMRLKDRSLFDIAKGPESTKPRAIVALLRRYPARRFVLVGDSGERDPEIYADIARTSPGRVLRVLVREAPGADNSRARFLRAFDGVGEKVWSTFKDAATVDGL
jgi:phosphatidate phosphatase APP1